MATTDYRDVNISFLSLRRFPYESMEKPSSAIYCLGNFDGVHTAHRRLISEGLEQKKRRSDALNGECLCGAFIFRSPSCDYFPPFVGEKKLHLTTLDQKLSHFAQAGLDFVAICEFDDVRELSPSDFLRLLRDGCGACGLVCGYNYAFGQLAKGTPQFIKDTLSEDEVTVSVVPRVTLEGYDVSSTNIRSLILSGDLERANSLLGYRYFLESTVSCGKRLGRRLGFPTANQVFPEDAVIPSHGVYATVCHTPSGSFPAVSNVGVRPTVDGEGQVNCETYILGFSGDLYGISVRVEFIKKLRDEKKFSDTDELRRAIETDATYAAEIFKNLSI